MCSNLFKKLNFICYLITTFIFISILFSDYSYAKTQRKDIILSVDDNTITAFQNIREIVRWYPRIVFETTPKELWKISFPSIRGQKKLIGPTSEINGKIYFAYTSFVMEFDLEKNLFTNRYQLLGEITEIKSDGEKLIISTFNGIRGQVWDKESVIRVTPKQLTVVAKYGTITNRDYSHIYVKRRDAEELSDTMDKVYIQTLIEKKYPPEKLEILKQEYLEAVNADTTNPWYFIFLALINENLEKKNYSLVYFQKALEIKSLVFYDYFQLSTFYEFVGQKALADKSYDLGMKDFLGRGYSPEQLTSLQSLLNYTTWLIPAINKLKEKDVDRTMVLMERFYKLSPFKEGNFNIISGSIKYLINLGKLSEGRTWQIRADNSKGYFFPGDYSILLSDIALNSFLASLISFIIFGMIFLVRDLSQFIEDARHKKFDLKELALKRYLSKRNIYSFFFLYCFSLISLGLCNNSLLQIGRIINEPASINSGTWGNYATVKYFSKDLQPTPERDFFLAIANQQLKDYQTSINLYKKINSPKSHNNLGTIYIRQNKKTEALNEFNKALKEDNNMVEAKYNLTLLDRKNKFPQKNEKAELFKKYAPDMPMIALPGEKYYRKAFYSGYSLKDFSPSNIVLFNKFIKDSDNPVIEFTEIVIPIFILFTIVIIMMLLSIFIPRTMVSTLNHNYFRRFFGFFIPGISYNWQLFGPLVFALWISLGINCFFFFGLGFETLNPSLGLLTTYAIPNYSLLSPFQSFDLPYTQEIGFISAIFFAMIWCFNLLYVFISKRYVVS